MHTSNAPSELFFKPLAPSYQAVREKFLQAAPVSLRQSAVEAMTIQIERQSPINEIVFVRDFTTLVIKLPLTFRLETLAKRCPAHMQEFLRWLIVTCGNDGSVEAANTVALRSVEIARQIFGNISASCDDARSRALMETVEASMTLARNASAAAAAASTAIAMHEAWCDDLPASLVTDLLEASRRAADDAAEVATNLCSGGDKTASAVELAVGLQVEDRGLANEQERLESRLFLALARRSALLALAVDKGIDLGLASSRPLTA